jgi:hypothetical protein
MRKLTALEVVEVSTESARVYRTAILEGMSEVVAQALAVEAFKTLAILIANADERRELWEEAE